MATPPRARPSTSSTRRARSSRAPPTRRVADPRARLVVRPGADARCRRSSRAHRARRAPHAQPLLDAAHTACRLVHGESDGLAGRHRRSLRRHDRRPAAVGGRRCVARRDRGRARRRYRRALRLRALGCRRALARRSAAARRRRRAARCPESSTSSKPALRYRVDVVGGQKTGFYLDQRDNRALVGAHARGRRVLNAFCYTGGFTLAALAGGAASVLSIDSSADALRWRARNLARNPALDARRAEWSEADVFAELRELRNRGASVRPDRARSAEVRADRRARAARGARVQGHQPARAQAARARRPARDVLVLGRDRRRRCSRRSSRARRSTPRRMRAIVGGSAPAPTIRWRWRFPKAIT